MQNKQTKIMVEAAIMIAMATVLSFIKVFKLPWGGSITLLSMLPIIIFSIRRGVKPGLGCAFVYALIQLLQGIVIDGLFAWGLSPVMLVGCILLDYLLAYTVLGLAGVFRKKELSGWILGICLAVVLRFVMHFISGYVIFHGFGELWGGFFTENSVLYSFCYNGAYMLPELVFTLIGAVILLKTPQTRKFLLADFDEANE